MQENKNMKTCPNLFILDSYLAIIASSTLTKSKKKQHKIQANFKNRGIRFETANIHSSSFCETSHFWQVVLCKPASTAANLLQDLSISLKRVQLLHCILQKINK